MRRSLLWVFLALSFPAMGFLALLLLSHSELPTGAIHDTLALGIGLGFLSDDQLLNRVKVIPCKGWSNHALTETAIEGATRKTPKPPGPVRLDGSL